MNTNPSARQASNEDSAQRPDDSVCDEVDAACLAEAHRRYSDFRAGVTTAKPVDEVITRLQNKAQR
jgi:hypothetical protein